MPLTNFEISPTQEIDDSIIVKADDGTARVFAEISRIFIKDAFQHGKFANHDRRSLVVDNIGLISELMSRKYDRGQWQPEGRCDSTIRRVDISLADLRSA